MATISEGNIGQRGRKLFGLLPQDAPLPAPQQGQRVQVSADGQSWTDAANLSPGQRRFGKHVKWRIVAE